MAEKQDFRLRPYYWLVKVWLVMPIDDRIAWLGISGISPTFFIKEACEGRIEAQVLWV